MPKRSFITALPFDVREAFHAELASCGFSQFQYLSEWLRRRGYAASKSAIHRYTTQYQASLRKRARRPLAVARREPQMQSLDLIVAALLLQSVRSARLSSYSNRPRD